MRSHSLAPSAYSVHHAAPRRSPLLWLAAVCLSLLLSGCLQDAHNANDGFNFNNPADPTPTTNNGIQIAEIDTALDIATIVNTSGTDQIMTGWTLVDNGITYAFTSGFTLNTNSFVRVHNAASTDTATDVYNSGLTFVGGSTATLNNGTTVISTCVVGNQTC